MAQQRFTFMYFLTKTFFEEAKDGASFAAMTNRNRKQFGKYENETT